MKQKAKYKYYQELISSKKDSRTAWNAINKLTNKAYKPQLNTKDVTPEAINNHFITIAHKLIMNNAWKENDLEHLIEYCKSKNIASKLTIPT